MARIRSTHPEQWTDDKFVTCSPLARLFAIAIRNEADDNGIFEWNPIKLKMRLLPADNCDVTELLKELLTSDQVFRFEINSKAYGMIRSFHKYQRPKSPTFIHPVPTEALPKGYELSKSHFPPYNGQDSGTSSEEVPKDYGKVPSEERREEKGREEKNRERASRLSPDWEPPDPWLEWASHERPEIEPKAEAQKFRDYWIAKPGKEGRKLDWQATWRNWIRNTRVTANETHNRPDNSAPGRVRAAQERRDRAEGRTFEHKPH